MLLPGGLPLVYGPDVGEGHVLAAEKADIGERFILCDQYFTLTQLAEKATDKLNNLGQKKYKIPTVMPLWVAKVVSVVGEAISNVFNFPPLMPKGQLHFLQWQAIPVSAKAKKELGWKPTKFRDALSETFDYLEIK